MSRIIAPETNMYIDGLFTVGSVGIIQTTKAGDPVLNLSVCFNSQEDNRESVPVWTDCQVWGDLAHHCERLVETGDTVYLKGKMHAPRQFIHRGTPKINLRIELESFTVVKKRYEVTGRPEKERIENQTHKVNCDICGAGDSHFSTCPNV